MSFKNDDDGQESHKQYYLPTVGIKDYNAMIDGRNFFDHPIKNDSKRTITLERLRQVNVIITQQYVY